MKKVFSKRWRLNTWDLIKAASLTAIVAVLDLIVQWGKSLGSEKPLTLDLEHIAGAAILAFAGYLLKNWATVAPKEAVEHAAKEAGYTNIK